LSVGTPAKGYYGNVVWPKIRRLHGMHLHAAQSVTPHENPELRPMMPAKREIVDNKACSHAIHGCSFPPFVVQERGESLEAWAQHEDPDFVTIFRVGSGDASSPEHLARLCQTYMHTHLSCYVQ
jgi:hypothetical protein